MRAEAPSEPVRAGEMRRGRTPTLIGLAAGALVATAALFIWGPARAVVDRFTTSWVPPQASGLALNEERERAQWQALGEQLSGRLVWSSNRSGNHELYLVRLPAGKLEQLTDHPNVDFGARFSPDGTRLVFMRSRREWVSFRETNAWDVHVMDLDSGASRRVARRGYHPTWSASERIVFQRDKQVIELDLAAETERVLFDTTASAEGRDLGDPELHPDGNQLAMVLARFGAIVTPTDGGEFLRLTPGHVCQTTWVPGTSDLLWMEAEGNGGTRVMRGSADGSRSDVFMDLPGDRSHEYFPKLSSDGSWMVWAAAAEGHEHDRADYEIYAWRVGDSWESARRLTFFSGNDQWPDIFLDG
ncbi:MAG: hypothetical protein GKS06_11330 [Acidobacteria bacterium]|nr:hypothetical protein [Acidobacteriota bacterium]